MLKLEILDPKFNSLEKEILQLGNWLIKKLASNEIDAKKQLPKDADFYLEAYLVNSETLAKNVYAYEYPEGFPNPENQQSPLGEIYINPDIAKEQGYSAKFMFVHAFLHLIGYEHEANNDTIAMETLEESLLTEFNKRSQ